jgi:hypothetical protein
LPVFKTGAFNRSATSPRRSSGQRAPILSVSPACRTSYRRLQTASGCWKIAQSAQSYIVSPSTRADTACLPCFAHSASASRGHALRASDPHQDASPLERMDYRGVVPPHRRPAKRRRPEPLASCCLPCNCRWGCQYAPSKTAKPSQVLAGPLKPGRCAASGEAASFMALSTLLLNSCGVAPIRTRGRKKSAHRNSANAVGVFSKPPALRT